MPRVALNLNSRSGTSKVYLVPNFLYVHLKVSIRTRNDDITSPSKSSFQRPLITSSQSLPAVTRPLSSLDSSNSHSTRQSFSPLTSKKRSFTETIDLTIDDEDSHKAEPSGRMKSRSSSFEAGIRQSGVKSGNFPFPVPLEFHSLNATYNFRPQI